MKSAADHIGRIVASVKAGRVLSAVNEETLKSALDKVSAGVKDIKSVLDSVDSSSDDTKASPAKPAADSKPDGATVDVPAGPGPASLRLLADLDSALWAEVI